MRSFDTPFNPDTIHQAIEAPYKEFKTGRRYPWAADRVRVLRDGDDLLHRHAALQQAVRVGFGEDAALGADLVQRQAFIGHPGQPLGRDLQLARGLLDKRAGAAAAGRLHVDLLALAVTAGREEQRLHVLAADLGDEVDLRMQLLDCS